MGVISAARKRPVLIILILVVGMILYVWEGVTVTNLLRHIEARSLEKQRLETKGDHLYAEVVHLNRMERIAEIASEKLDMVLSSERPIDIVLHAVQGDSASGRGIAETLLGSRAAKKK